MMWMSKLLLPMCLIVVCESLKSGAPSKACIDMTPHHRNFSPQSLVSPFKVEAVPGENAISVKISHPNSDQFKGFLLQARLASNKKNILNGKFSEDDLAQESSCEIGMGTFLTHKNAEPKTAVHTTWTPPAGFEGDVIFRATVVKEFSKFWTGIETTPIFIKSTESSTAPVTPKEKMGIYKECGIVKGCFGLPSGCVADSKCSLIFSYEPKENYSNFELIGTVKGSSGWIAIGFSDDQKMGDDSVTECLYEDGEYTLQQSWNEPPPRRNNVKINNPQGSIIEKTGQNFENGVLTCRWKQGYETLVRNHRFDLKNEQYYLLLAFGPMSSKGVKRKHTEALESANKIDLNKISSIQGKPSLLIKIHGSFMVVAWLCLVSIGILLARYYKHVWESSTLCKTKIWFALHRLIMLLAFGLVIAGFVVIFIYEDGWSEAYPHSVLGCITTGLSVIQVIAGLARPNPNSSKRQAFNWLHWLNGNCSQILAIITIFFAIQLKKANLPNYCYWILIGFIAFHLIFHLVMQSHTCYMDKKDTSEIKLHQLGQKRESETVRDAPGGGFRRFMLGIYVVVSFGIAAALVLIICLN